MNAAARRPHVYLVAGEESGDRLGAALIRALRRARPDIEFSAVGGSQRIPRASWPVSTVVNPR